MPTMKADLMVILIVELRFQAKNYWHC